MTRLFKKESEYPIDKVLNAEEEKSLEKKQTTIEYILMAQQRLQIMLNAEENIEVKDRLLTVWKEFEQDKLKLLLEIRKLRGWSND